MTAKKWIATIEGQLQALKLSDPAFKPIVKALAAVLEQRDKTAKELAESGGRSVIEYTNKFGATNMTKNPLLVLWDDLNKSALAYWRELGLTPSSYRKITGDAAPKKEQLRGLAAALQSIEED